MHSEEVRARAWAREMQQVHRRLREALDLAREQVEDGGTPDRPTRDRLLYCWGFCRALDGHHRSEDHVLFPRLVAAHPDLRPVVARLEQDHSMIAHLLVGLDAALSAGAGAAETLRHLEGIGAIMENHFRYEERELLPRLGALDGLDLDPTEVLGPLA